MKAKRLIRAPKPVRHRSRWKIVVKPVLAQEAEGFALIHNTDRTISLASVRSNEAMVESLAKVFDVSGYRIGKVRVGEVKP